MQWISTARLGLRQVTVSDVADVHRLHQDPVANQRDPDGAHPDPSFTLGFIQSIRADWRRDGLGYWAIFTADPTADEICWQPGVLVGVGGARRAGYLGLDGRYHAEGSDSESVWNVYYRITPAAWGLGYAGSVVRAAAREVDRISPGADLLARIRPANLASQRVATKLGMQLIATATDHAGQPELTFHAYAADLAG